jgi:hypothetical protein
MIVSWWLEITASLLYVFQVTVGSRPRGNRIAGADQPTSRTNEPTPESVQPPNTNDNIPMDIDLFIPYLPDQLITAGELWEEECDEPAVSLIRHFVELYPVTFSYYRNIRAIATLTSLSYNDVRDLMMETSRYGRRSRHPFGRCTSPVSKSFSVPIPMSVSTPRKDHAGRSVRSDLISQQGSRKGEDLEL